ncbi:Leucyl-cystinyl aminopeptidase [Liparis tanakae]|uniref:Aminopeptidase n=1 Tax=Liparis tanakae TaxID=230148 RepID=A0A4Z2F503_9TELE|nr:Leucyl-cystinyl aminopeptidase [Liparis tanakae]
MDPFDSNNSERANLPRNMIENSMFEEEPDVVDLAKESAAFPTFPALDPDEVAFEPRSSRLLVRGLGENDMDDDEEDCESSARLLGMSCSRPSTRTSVVCVLFLLIVAAMTMVMYFLPGCIFTKTGCPRTNKTAPSEPVYPASTSGEPFPWTQLRLPRSIHPLSYDLTLDPDLDNMTFSGRAVISMSVLHATKLLVLHAAQLNISRATFKRGDGEAGAVTVLEYKPTQQISVKFSEELKAGQHCVLTLDYSANLSHTYDGFYNSSYTDSGGVKRVLAATQFEPLAARKAFPCFDEPSFKATFLIRISRKPSYLTLSNMPRAKSTQLPNGLVQDEFEKTIVNMSTYLVAFIVSVYSVPDKKNQTDYALDTACKLLEFYNDFFEISYPLKKLDLVAIPDFLAGAMENWGLITFRETSLLVGKHSSSLEKQVVASVVAHELAHQWFGNLVTMRWWNDLWLNEGFATYMQYMSLHEVFPQLDIGNLFLAVRFRALDNDALNSSHAVSMDVNKPEQVEEMFDSVSYEKGASILLMLHASLPGEQFRKGIIQYLKQFSGLNTDTNDLWNSLTQVEVSPQHQNVSEMMRSWTSQKGFPLVTVSREGGQVTLTQEHFLLTSDSASPASSLWNIPVMYVTDNCSVAPECTQVFNLKSKSGFYVVHYGDEGWAALTAALLGDVSVLTPEDRASLVHDVFALSRLGRVSFSQVLNLLSYMSNETETAPVVEALLQLDVLYHLLDQRQEHSVVARMKSYILHQFGSLMDRQTWGEEEESVSKQELRSALLAAACGLNEERCVQRARAQFSRYAQSNGTARYVLHAYAQSLGEVILKAGLRGDLIQTQELPLVVYTVCRGFAGYLFVWDFIQENWDRLLEKFPLGSFAIQSIVKSATSQFSTQAHLNQVEGFFSSLKERGSQMRSVQEAVETIRLNQRWMDRNLPALRERL